MPQPRKSYDARSRVSRGARRFRRTDSALPGRRPRGGTGQSGSSRRPGTARRDTTRISDRPDSLVELRIRGGPVPHWMQDLGRRWGAGIRLHVCRRADGSPRRLLQLLEITASAPAIPEITAYLRHRKGAEEVSLTQLEPHRLLVRLVGPLPALCHSVFEMGAICMSCPFLPSVAAQDEEAREGEWRVLTRRVRDAHPLLASFSPPGNSPASLIRIGSYRGSPDLTARQELAIGTAFVLGYYDYPRRAQLRDVAKSLGISRVAALENLRRGMRKLAAQRHNEAGVVRALSAPETRPSSSKESPDPSLERD